MFIGRGLKQNRPVATSSLIFVLRRCYPDKRHQVEVINCKDVSAEIETTIQNIRDGRKISRKKLLQGKLLESVTNWNFIKQEKSFLDFYDMYLKTAETISIYYNHALAEHHFKNRFYFDGSFNIPTKEIQTDRIKDTDYWEIPTIKSRGFLASVIGYYPKNKKIKIAEGSQGMKMLNTKYKVIWRYANPDKFLFIKGENVFPRFQQFCIASNSKGEILYLLSLLNSKITNLLIDRLLKSENEKDVLLGITAIKEFVRVPKIIEDNECVKDEIINRAEEMLSLEKVRLSDLVDFSGIILQKFDGVKVEGRRLVLRKGQKEMRLAIKDRADVVEKTVAERYPSEELEFESGGIRLSELKELPVIDFRKQTELKDYIDDLVFTLYFNVPLAKVGLEYADEIKEACRKSQHYRITQS